MRWLKRDENNTDIEEDEYRSFKLYLWLPFCVLGCRV